MIMSRNERESVKCLTANLYKEEIEMNSMHSVRNTDKHQTDWSEEGYLVCEDNRDLDSREETES